MALDRSRPFGEVFGVADHKFVQDGKKFDHEGNELGSEGVAPKAGTKAKSSGKPAQEADQVGTQLQE